MASTCFFNCIGHFYHNYASWCFSNIHRLSPLSCLHSWWFSFLECLFPVKILPKLQSNLSLLLGTSSEVLPSDIIFLPFEFPWPISPTFLSLLFLLIFCLFQYLSFLYHEVMVSFGEEPRAPSTSHSVWYMMSRLSCLLRSWYRLGKWVDIKKKKTKTKIV